MAKKRAGWERIIYLGGAGSTAATQLDSHVENINLSFGAEYNETTDRGDGSAVPKMMEQLVKQTCELTFSMHYDDGDAAVSTLIAAAHAGTPIAFLVKRHSGGAVEFDGDCYIDVESPGELTGGQVVNFTCHPTDDGGRDWSYT